MRLTPQDRIPSGEEDKPKKAASRRKADERKACVEAEEEEPGIQSSPGSDASILREAAQLPDNGTGARPIGYSGVR